MIGGEQDERETIIRISALCIGAFGVQQEA